MSDELQRSAANVVGQLQRTDRDWTDLKERLASATTEELRNRLVECLEATAEIVMELAMIARELESRGENLNDQRNSMIPHLRRVAWGQMLPEVVSTFSCRPSLINKIGNLPIPDQKKCLSADGFKLVIGLDQDGNYECLHRRLIDLTREEQQQLFGPEGLRDEMQQARYLRARLAHRTANQPKIETEAFTTCRQGIRVTRPVIITWATVKRMLETKPK